MWELKEAVQNWDIKYWWKIPKLCNKYEGIGGKGTRSEKGGKGEIDKKKKKGKDIFKYK